VYSFVVDVLNIGKNLIPGVVFLRIVHVQDVDDHLVEDLDLAIHLGVGGSGLGEIGVQQ
jgi:hypothetical protein